MRCHLCVHSLEAGGGEVKQSRKYTVSMKNTSGVRAGLIRGMLQKNKEGGEKKTLLDLQAIAEMLPQGHNVTETERDKAKLTEQKHCLPN